MTMTDELRHAVGEGLIRLIDYHFARHMVAMSGSENPRLALAAALASARVGGGDVCLDLTEIAGNRLETRDGGDFHLTVPSVEELVETLRASDVVGPVGTEAPLILDHANRLYLGRYWWFEEEVAEALRARAGLPEPEWLDQERLKASLERMFPSDSAETNWQRVAAAIAVLRRFAVISGGPGTGKTHTVTGILALLVEQRGNAPLNIALAAPTGKAAARLTESIRLAKPAIPCNEALKQKIPEEAVTIHRLLGMRPGRVEPRFNAGNRLNLDVLVVDEASMIDLPMMTRLLAALPEAASLILLGDKDQLASVEAGSVFADIAGRSPTVRYTASFGALLVQTTGQPLEAGEGGSRMGDCIGLLKKSYRFDDGKGIGALARAVNAGDSGRGLELLRSGADEVGYRSPTPGELKAAISGRAAERYATCFRADSPQEALGRFSRFRILCGLRAGQTGVEGVNRTVEEAFRANGWIEGDGRHYAGRPVMVTQNDYALGLFNGDIGILWPEPDDPDSLWAWFVRPDNTFRRILPSRLPPHETAYAMTVHKSQGSEFDAVLVLLPFEPSEVITRELLYTGITRARSSVEVWGTAAMVEHCIRAKLRRVTGLAEKLRLGEGEGASGIGC